MECEEFHDTDYTNYQFRRPFWLKKILWLCHRTLLTIARDPTIQTLRIVQKIVRPPLRNCVSISTFFYHFFCIFITQAIALMAGFCFFGSAELTQRGIQSVQGAVFIMITENTFGPMYSVLAIFPQGFPLFLREKRSGLYNTVLYYVANVIALVSKITQVLLHANQFKKFILQIPGLIIEPVVFVVIAYFLAGLRTSLNAFLITLLTSILVINVATSCGKVTRLTKLSELSTSN